MFTPGQLVSVNSSYREDGTYFATDYNSTLKPGSLSEQMIPIPKDTVGLYLFKNPISNASSIILIGEQMLIVVDSCLYSL